MTARKSRRRRSQPTHFPAPGEPAVMVPDVRLIRGELWRVIGGTPKNPTLVKYVPPPRPWFRLDPWSIFWLGWIAACVVVLLRRHLARDE